jgi:hypothetical protein
VLAAGSQANGPGGPPEAFGEGEAGHYVRPEHSRRSGVYLNGIRDAVDSHGFRSRLTRPTELLIKGSDRVVCHWPASGYLVRGYRRAGQRKRSARADVG